MNAIAGMATTSAVDGGQLTEYVTGPEYIEEDFMSLDGDGHFDLAAAHDEQSWASSHRKNRIE
jgi:hypothetical protein